MKLTVNILEGSNRFTKLSNVFVAPSARPYMRGASLNTVFANFCAAYIRRIIHAIDTSGIISLLP